MVSGYNRAAMKQSKADKLQSFDPGAVGQRNGRLFGLPFDYDECDLVVLPVPWDVTTSYRPGTAAAPQAILDASTQIDLYDPQWPDAWQAGAFFLSGTPPGSAATDWAQESERLRAQARRCIEAQEDGEPPDSPGQRRLIEEVNEGSSRLDAWVRAETDSHLSRGKIVGVLGGDHSVPLGALVALASRPELGDFGVLHIDAHADLREAYEGFHGSHASIMNNALRLPSLRRLVQVGIRDYSAAEAALARSQGDRVKQFPMRSLRREQFRGETWDALCRRIIDALPERVYVSFDIDGLDPALCPGTGTPVPGGLSFEEACHLLDCLAESGKQVIGFDLCEVSPASEWDAIVGARVLFRLVLLAAVCGRRPAR